MKTIYTIGVDFGGTNLRIAAYAEGTEFGRYHRVSDLSEGREAILRQICEAASSLIRRDPGLWQARSEGVRGKAFALFLPLIPV